LSHFRHQARHYAEFRPDYPPEMFTYLASQCANRKLVWDCATGSGQAAIGLGKHFDRVIATDISQEQISFAKQNPSVTYKVAPAEKTHLPDAVFDLVTIFQALHWLKRDLFFEEVKRVLKPVGIFAVAVYGDPVLEGPAANDLMQHYNHRVVGSYWPSERKLVDEAYASIRFPFDEILAPEFTLQKSWTLGALAGYLRTWSATQRYIEKNESDPVSEFEATMREHCSEPAKPQTITWPFTFRVFRT
jgi:SAM-dependent methyltransferase